MNWTDIIVACISLVGAFIGTAYGIHRANNLTMYRIEQLEKKVDLHNGVVERVVLCEQQIKDIRTFTDKSNSTLARQGEQIDSVFTLAEKNQSRIEIIERSMIGGSR